MLNVIHYVKQKQNENGKKIGRTIVLVTVTNIPICSCQKSKNILSVEKRSLSSVGIQLVKLEGPHRRNRYNYQASNSFIDEKIIRLQVQ